MSKETLEQAFSVDGPAVVDVRNIRGSVDVRPGEAGIVTVSAVKHGGSGDAERTTIELTQQENGHLVFVTRFAEKDEKVRRGRVCKVDYTVHLPQGSELSVHCVSSSMAVRDLEGQFDLHAVSGAIDLIGLAGKIQATSVSGAIRGERLAGPAEIRSVSGSVRIVDSELPTVRGSSVSGSMEMECALGAGPHRFDTVSGHVRLTMPPEAGYSVHMSSLSGHFKSELPFTSKQQRRGKVDAELHGGGPSIRCHTVSGHLSIR